MNTIQIIYTVLLTVSFVAMSGWLIMYLRVASSVRASISVLEGRDAPEPEGGWPGVSVVIPAHNEEDVIERCARSLMAQRYDRMQVVFALDRCTDRTEELLRAVIGDDPRFEVVVIDECPEDWAGKCNAAATGARRATGDFLVFTDADTEFDPDLVRSSIAIAIEREVDLLSILSTLSSARWDERIVQPVATMNLLRMHPIDSVNRRERPRAFANGQFMLFTRSIYERVGGHEGVHLDLLEDIAFARQVQKQGGRGIIVNADRMLNVTMYEGLRALCAGWKRIYIEVARRRPRRLINWGIRILVAGVMVPAVEVATIVFALLLVSRGGDALWSVLGTGVAAVALFLQFLSLGWIYRLGHAPLSGLIAFPIGSLIVGWIMFDGARDLLLSRPIHWGGREYVLKPD